MASLSNVIKKYKEEGRGNTAAFAGGISEKLKEKIDPRQIIKQDGILTALFPKLKAFKAKGISDKETLSSSKILQAPSLGSVEPILQNIQSNTTLTAKSVLVLPSMARDINLVRQNIGKLVKLMGGSAASKADMFFARAGERESIYETKLGKLQGKKTPTTPTPLKDETKTKEENSLIMLFGSLGPLATLFSALLSPLGLLVVGMGALVAAMKFFTGKNEEGNKKTAEGIASAADVSTPGKSIMEAVESEPVEVTRERQERERLALADAPFATKYYGYKKSEYLAKKGVGTSPTQLSGEGYEQMAVNLIKKEEGLPKDGKAYKDAGGISIGYGHQITSSEKQQGFIQAGDERIPLSPNIMDTKLTKEQAEKLLMQDLPKYIDRARIPLGEAWDKLNDQQKATMVSYAYNTGSTQSLVKSGLKDAIMSGNTEAAAKIISEKGIKTSQGQYHSGLARRRGTEAELFAAAPQKGEAIKVASAEVAAGQRVSEGSSATIVDNSTKNNVSQSNPGQSKPTSAYDRDIFQTLVSIA